MDGEPKYADSLKAKLTYLDNWLIALKTTLLSSGVQLHTTETQLQIVQRPDGAQPPRHQQSTTSHNIEEPHLGDVFNEEEQDAAAQNTMTLHRVRKKVCHNLRCGVRLSEIVKVVGLTSETFDECL